MISMRMSHGCIPSTEQVAKNLQNRYINERKAVGERGLEHTLGNWEHAHLGKLWRSELGTGDSLHSRGVVGRPRSCLASHIGWGRGSQSSEKRLEMQGDLFNRNESSRGFSELSETERERRYSK